MDSIISTFHIDWKIIIAQVINFGVVFIVLYIFALKPLGTLMKERSKKIEQVIFDGIKNEAMLKATSLEYDEMLTKARAEANKLATKSKKEGEEEKNRMLEEAKAEVEELIRSGRKTLEADKVKIVEEAKKEIVSLVTLAAEKLISNKKDLNNL